MPVLNTLYSQKIANPNQRKLKGIKKISVERITTPFFGLPVHKSFSSLLRICLNSFSISKSILWRVLFMPTANNKYTQVWRGGSVPCIILSRRISYQAESVCVYFRMRRVPPESFLNGKCILAGRRLVGEEIQTRGNWKGLIKYQLNELLLLFSAYQSIRVFRRY